MNSPLANFRNQKEGVMRAYLFLAVMFVTAASAVGNVIQVPGDQPTIQDGIRATSDGDTVLVSPGTYFENINFCGKNIVVVSHYILNEDSSFIEATVIDGSNPSNPDSASCVVMCSGEDSTAVLRGFTLTGGAGTRWLDDLFSQSFWRAGGGIFTYKSSPTIRDNLIVNNAVTNVTGVNGAQGGGLLCYYGNPQILSNVFKENQANYGAGIVTDYSGARIKRNIFCRNTAGQSYGGGAYWTIGDGPAPIIIENNTMVENVSGSNGGAISIYGQGATITARNNIIWGNTQSQGGPISGHLDITYSDIEGGCPGQGNINADPLFENENYHLSQQSPCIDSGDPESPLDPDGTRADMGARVYALFDAPLIRFSDYVIDDSQGNNNGRADANETVNLLVTFSNTRLDATGVSATLTTLDQDVQITEAVSDFGALPRDGSTANESNPFSFSVNPATVAHPSMFHLEITADGGYGNTESFEIIIGTSMVLLIDDDGGDAYEAYYTDALKTKQIFPEKWNVSTKGSPANEKLGQFEAVIWITGDDGETSLTSEEQAVIALFLNEGGNLIIAGSNIGYDLVEAGSLSDAEFFANYLHAEYVSNSVVETFLSGVEGDPITGQFALLALEESQTSPSVISPLTGASTILTYYSTQQTAAIKYDGDHKVVYFATGLEGIGAMSGGDDEVRGTLLENVFQWFSYVPIAGDVNQDGTINILDVLMGVNIILGVVHPTSSQEWAVDCNADGIINILDVIGIVNVVLGIGTCP